MGLKLSDSDRINHCILHPGNLHSSILASSKTGRVPLPSVWEPERFSREGALHVRSVAQPCLGLCDPVDCSPPGSSVMGFPRQESWRALTFPSPGDLPTQGPNSHLPPWQVGSFPRHHLGSPKGPQTPSNH